MPQRGAARCCPPPSPAKTGHCRANNGWCGHAKRRTVTDRDEVIGALLKGSRMSAAQSEDTLTAKMPDGTWSVDTSQSELMFRSRGVFGLVPVRGTFTVYEGELRVAG